MVSITHVVVQELAAFNSWLTIIARHNYPLNFAAVVCVLECEDSPASLHCPGEADTRGDVLHVVLGGVDHDGGSPAPLLAGEGVGDDLVPVHGQD